MSIISLWKKKNINFFIFFTLIFFGCASKPYSNLSDYFFEERNNLLYNLSETFVPETVINMYRMRDFISSEYFGKFKSLKGDIPSMDEIYNYALYITDNNIQQSLFIISVATLPYKSTPAKFPILKFDMMFYFSLESDSLFHKRFKNLPSKLFEDSPKNSFGDKDKISHFFGSAYLAYFTDDAIIPRTIGNIIELGEAVFQLEGFMDERDKKSNEIGILFGKDLLLDPLEKPSKYLGKRLK
jgi:hypothetical protein